MILTKTEILKRMDAGQIMITPFNMDNLGPNSYDLTLNNKLLVYNDPVISVKDKNSTTEIIIPEAGYILKPGKLYIASVNEYTQASGLVGVLYGKSSLGRLGLFIHVTAGFVDSGYGGNLTLELAVVQPLKIFPNIKIGQIAYSEEKGVSTSYSGKYQGDTTAQASKSHKDFA